MFFNSPTSVNPFDTSKVIYTSTLPNTNCGEAFQAKQAGKKTSHVVFVLDASSSMFRHKAKTISAFNEFLQGQVQDAKASNIETFVSLYTFNGTTVTNTASRINVNDFTPLSDQSYLPNGNTNLNDAIGSVIGTINNDLAKFKKSHRDSVIVVILTDGEENASKVFKNSDIKQMIKKCENKNWGFLFLGANIDSFAVGSTYGFTQANTLQYSMENIGAANLAATRAVNSMKAAYTVGLSSADAYTTSTFTDQERAAADDKKSV